MEILIKIYRYWLNQCSSTNFGFVFPTIDRHILYSRMLYLEDNLSKLYSIQLNYPNYNYVLNQAKECKAANANHKINRFLSISEPKNFWRSRNRTHGFSRTTNISIEVAAKSTNMRRFNSAVHNQQMLW